MGAEDYKKQLEFEHKLKVGDVCGASWTANHCYYAADVRVLAINEKSYRVETINTIQEYPMGYILTIQRLVLGSRWSWNNRLLPPKEVKV